MAINVVKEVATLRHMTVSELRARYHEVFGEDTNARNKQWLNAATAALSTPRSFGHARGFYVTASAQAACCHSIYLSSKSPG